MLRISKKLDYSLIILAHLARLDPKETISARAIAQTYGLPQPITSSLLKSLSSGELVDTVRGVKGGHRLALAPERITLERISEVIDGPFQMADCVRLGKNDEECTYEGCCPVRTPVRTVHEAVRSILASVTLDQLAGTAPFEIRIFEDRRSSGSRREGIPSTTVSELTV